jgi:hypothetical protein
MVTSIGGETRRKKSNITWTTRQCFAGPSYFSTEKKGEYCAHDFCISNNADVPDPAKLFGTPGAARTMPKMSSKDRAVERRRNFMFLA